MVTSMDVRNCKNCGKLFNYLGGQPICPDCGKKLEDKFLEVKQYIYDNPQASIQQVSEENDVSVQQLRAWVRQERLEFTEASLVGLNCEKCGALIRSGRFCAMCKAKLGETLSNVYKTPVPEAKKADASARMRFLDN